MTVSALGMRETYKKLILDRESTKCAICREDFVEVVTPSYGKVLIAHGLRPLKMLFTEPLVAVLSLYIGFAFGVIYGCFTAVPYIFTTQYGFSAQQDGLVFLGMSAGYVIATIGVIILALRKRRAIVKMIAAKQRPTVPAPEAQLLLAQVGSPLIVVSLFMLGWTAHARVHWIVPVIALGIYACGFILVFVSHWADVEHLVRAKGFCSSLAYLYISTWLMVHNMVPRPHQPIEWLPTLLVLAFHSSRGRVSPPQLAVSHMLTRF